MSINDGGNAFPVVMDDDKGEHLTVEYGMSVRTWLAGMALQGLLASTTDDFTGSRRWQVAASEAVKHADALIEALEGEEEPK